MGMSENMDMSEVVRSKKNLGAAFAAVGATNEFHMSTTMLVASSISALESLQPKYIYIYIHTYIEISYLRMISLSEFIGMKSKRRISSQTMIREGLRATMLALGVFGSS